MSDNAPAGWYPQPDGSQRYYDGTAWTEQVRPAAMAPVPTPGPADGPGGDAYRDTFHGATAKNPTLHLVASLFIPGLGSMLNGETRKGVAILLGYLVALPLCLLLVGVPILIGVWIYGMIDAHAGAVRWNAARGLRG